MENRKLLELMKADIKTIENKGIETINVKALDSYIDELDKIVTEKVNPEDHNKRFQAQIEEYRARNEASLETLRSVIIIAMGALKSSILINGGAAVALLTFMGNVWGKETSNINLLSLKCSLLSFAVGVTSGAIAWGVSYLTQRFFHYGHLNIGNYFNYVAIALVFGAYASFLYGAIQVYSAFKI